MKNNGLQTEYIQTQYDESVDARYIPIAKKKVHKTVPVSGDCIVDVARDGSVVGVELLGKSANVSKSERINIVTPITSRVFA